MQIFSKLQRNSTDKIFIRLLLVYFVNFFGSFSPFFPIMLGIFIVCESFLMGVFFIVLFSFFHNFSVYYFLLVYLLMKFFLLDKLKDIVDFQYQNVVSLFLIYLFLGAYLFYNTSTNHFMLLIYLIYNYAFDLIFIRFMKCELKSY